MQKNEIFFRCVYFLTAAVILFNLGFAIFDALCFNMDNLPEGNEMLTVSSPDGESVITLYLIENSLGSSVRGTVTEDNSVRNIYWQTGTDRTEAYWISKEIVFINDVPLNVANKDSYDCRRGISIFNEGALAGDFAIENS